MTTQEKPKKAFVSVVEMSEMHKNSLKFNVSYSTVKNDCFISNFIGNELPYKQCTFGDIL